jgi:flagellin
MALTVSLSQGVLQNLIALQNTTNAINTVQNQLATGKKVNTALDNPGNFFLAAGFQTNINALNTILDNITIGQRTIDQTNTGITQLTNLIQSAQGSLAQALGSAPTAAVLTGLATAVSGTTFTTATTLASIGFAATDVITISDGTANTVTFTAAANTTVQSLLNAINVNATTNKNRAEIAGDGRLLLEGAGGTFSITITTNSAANGVALANLGFNANTNNGSINNTVAAGSTSTTRVALAAQFDALRSQIDQLAIDSGYNGVSLINSQSTAIFTNQTSTAKIILTGNNDTSSGLGLTSTFSANTFQDNYEVNAAVTATKAALTSLQNQASTYSSQVSILQSRASFTTQTVATLTTGINDLTLADSNQVGAQLLALQTRQSLSSTALSLATQADQNVLRLFR